MLLSELKMGTTLNEVTRALLASPLLKDIPCHHTCYPDPSGCKSPKMSLSPLDGFLA